MNLLKKETLILSIVMILSLSFNDSFGLLTTAEKVEMEFFPGESQTFQWGISQEKDASENIKIRVEGNGTEFISFEEDLKVIPGGPFEYVEFTVTIPKSYSGENILKPKIYATEIPEAAAGAVVAGSIHKEITLVIKEPEQESGGGCLIATAAYGSELAPQVQFLREIRDNTILSTASGSAFMTGFNQLYYSFSPTIADLERQNPVFQEAVRLFIAPMLSTLSIMNLAEEGNETQVLGLGISVIALNVGMYVAAPVVVSIKVRSKIISQ